MGHGAASKIRGTGAPRRGCSATEPEGRVICGDSTCAARPGCAARRLDLRRPARLRPRGRSATGSARTAPTRPAPTRPAPTGPAANPWKGHIHRGVEPANILNIHKGVFFGITFHMCTREGVYAKKRLLWMLRMFGALKAGFGVGGWGLGVGGWGLGFSLWIRPQAIYRAATPRRQVAGAGANRWPAPQAGEPTPGPRLGRAGASRWPKPA